MEIHNLKSIKMLEPVPGYRVRFVHSEKMTFAFWDILQGYSVPQHSHPNEQVIKMLEGELKLIVDGKEHILTKDDVMIIPGGVEHGAYSLTDCKTIDTFCPVRENYKNL